MGSLSRRKKGLLYVTAAATTLIMTLVVFFVLDGKSGETYRPGHATEGLTSRLSRNAPEDAPTVLFEDVAWEMGLRFRHFPGVRGSLLLEDIGSGAAWGDYDDDGDPDAFLVNLVTDAGEGQSGSALFRNDGVGFVNVSLEAGIAAAERGSAAAWGDFDGDGRLDLWTSSVGHNRLYRNLGDGRFAERSEEARIRTPEGFWAGISPGDYDRDGDLDVYVAGYVRLTDDVGTEYSRQYEVDQPASLNPSSYEPERNLLFRNDGSGRFSEVAVEAGVANEHGRSLAASWADFDADGWLDLYVANDVSDNALFRNLGDGTFEDVSLLTNAADYRGAMGLGVGDWNGDGDLDLFITHWIAQENALLDNLSDRGSAGYGLRFTDVADRFGLGQSSLDFVGWATGFADFDLDGRDDLYVVNGSTFQRRDDPTLLVPMANLLYWNGGPQRGFFGLDAGAATDSLSVGRGGALSDFDGDGDVDILVVNHGGVARLLRNETAAPGNFIRVRLAGPAGNTFGLGSVIQVWSGNSVQTRQVGAQASYLSQHDPVQVFGLGSSVRADSLVVRWASGQRSVLQSVAAGSDVVVPIDDSRQRTVDFWSAYRQATRQRLAGRIDSASSAYTRALRLRPEHEDALYYFGSTALAAGRETTADSAWTRLTSINPLSSRAHMQLGALRLCAPISAFFDPHAAISHFQSAHEINPVETGPMARLAYAWLVQDRVDLASAYLDAVLASDPGNQAARLWRAFAYSSDNQTAEAQAFLSDPDHRAAAQIGVGEGDTVGGTAMTGELSLCPPFEEFSEERPSMEALTERIARLRDR